MILNNIENREEITLHKNKRWNKNPQIDKEIEILLEKIEKYNIKYLTCKQRNINNCDIEIFDINKMQ